MQLVFYLLYGNVQVAFAFLLSCFFSSSRFALVTLWIWVIGSGIFAASLLGNIFRDAHTWVVFLEIVPTVGVYRCAHRAALPGILSFFNSSDALPACPLGIRCIPPQLHASEQQCLWKAAWPS